VSETHNELTTLVVDVSLQRRLTQTLTMVRAGILSTNPIIHHGVADTLRHATKPINILDTVQEPRDPASSRKCGEALKNSLQFPSK
jgi:hypothetical protein